MIVVDVSVAASWYFRRQATRAADLLRSTDDQVIWLAPHCFVYEWRNLLIRFERTRKLSWGESEAILADLDVFGLRVEQPPDIDGLVAATEYARAGRFSLFDGLYLELAMRAGATLATRDSGLRDFARRLGAVVYDAGADA